MDIIEKWKKCSVYPKVAQLFTSLDSLCAGCIGMPLSGVGSPSPMEIHRLEVLSYGQAEFIGQQKRYKVLILLTCKVTLYEENDIVAIAATALIAI